jgi:hypothetical protein
MASSCVPRVGNQGVCGFFLYIKNAAGLKPDEESPNCEAFRNAQQLPSALRLLIVNLDCPYADRLHWRCANYETNVETVLGCDSDTDLHHWNWRRANVRGRTQERVRAAAEYSATARMVALDEWKHHARRHQARS